MSALIEPPLHTFGKDILDAGNKSITLRCVNWYGAHDVSANVGGVGQASLHDIVTVLVSAGFNCVQLAFSTQFVMAGDMASLDATVNASTEQGMAVILNSHTNRASWCCKYNDDNGVWNIPGDTAFSTETWLHSLETIVSRYKENPLVIGIDVKNEVHSTPRASVTWGASDNIDTDWKAASEAAAGRVHAVNGEALIFVQGMCYALDLRRLHSHPPEFQLASSKLVYVAHIYPWSFLWSYVDSEMNIRQWAAVLLVIIFLSIFVIRKPLKVPIIAMCRHAVCLLLTASCAFAIGAMSILHNIGCETSEYDATLFILSVLLLATLVWITLANAASPTHTRDVWIKASALALISASSVLLLFCLWDDLRLSMLQTQVRNFVLDSRHVHPIFVGEFGMRVNIVESDSLYWTATSNLIRSNSLSWSYWALNANKFSEKLQYYIPEPFGLMASNYKTWNIRRMSALPW